jgi:hypothetical protein
MVNPPKESKQFIKNQIPHGEISRYKSIKKVANFGDLLPKKAICGLFGNCKG